MRRHSGLLQQKKLSNEKVGKSVSKDATDGDKNKSAETSKLLEKRTSINKAVMKSTKGGNDLTQNGSISPNSKSGSKSTDVSSLAEPKGPLQKDTMSRKSPIEKGSLDKKSSSSILLPGQTKYAMRNHQETANKDPSVNETGKSEKTPDGKTNNETEKENMKVNGVCEIKPSKTSKAGELESNSEVNKNNRGPPRDSSKRRRHKSKQAASETEKSLLVSDGDIRSDLNPNASEGDKDLRNEPESDAKQTNG